MPARAAPRHEQISTWLRERLASGSLPVHAQLPSEHDLCAQFGVSRVTVRRALATLEADGLIYRRQGLGSFAAPPRVPQGLVRLTDFAQDMARAGLTASSRLLHHAPEPCPAAAAAELGLAPEAAVVRLDRLRLADDAPVALDRTWLPPFYAQLLEGHDLTQTTLYRLLESTYGIIVVLARYRIEAVAAEPATAEVLGVPAGAALLLVSRTSYTAGERVVYFQRRYYRPDRVAFELALARDEAAPVAGAMPLREFEPVFRT